MSTYQVIARKWRPIKFEDVIGQEHITRTLRNAIANDRIGHAFLFSGPRGVGKTTTARILAKALNCEKGITAEPCNVCEFCREITSGAAFDVLEIDGASNRGIDEIRDIKSRTQYQPAKFRFKIFIIDEVHMLTKEAFNALLKTLEEPPAHVKFIMATTESHKVPITILSRCQRYDFRLVSTDKIAALLEQIVASEKVEISHSSLMTIARMAEGSVRDGESLLEQVISFGGETVTDEDVSVIVNRMNFELLYPLLEAVINSDLGRAMVVLRNLLDAGSDLVQLVRDLAESLRDVLFCRSLRQPEQMVERMESEIANLKNLGKITTDNKLIHQISILSKAENEIKSSTLGKILLELAIIRLCKVEDVKDIETIVAAAKDALKDIPIDDLEKRLSEMEKVSPPSVQSYHREPVRLEKPTQTPVKMPVKDEPAPKAPEPPKPVEEPSPPPQPSAQPPKDVKPQPKEEPPPPPKPKAKAPQEVTTPIHRELPRDPAECDKVWWEIVNKCSEKGKPRMENALSASWMKSFDETGLVVQVPENKYKILDKKDTEETLKEICQEIFGKHFNVELEVIDGGSENAHRTPSQMDKETEEQEKKGLFQKAKRNPSFRLFLQQMDLSFDDVQNIREVERDCDEDLTEGEE